eukprot:4633706-Lingulodinium_polyedra.AAC.1
MGNADRITGGTQTRRAHVAETRWEHRRTRTFKHCARATRAPTTNARERGMLADINATVARKTEHKRSR